MSDGLCAESGCSLVAWHACERCHRPFCFTHARFLPHEVARIGQEQVAMIEFEFVCLDCLPDTADEDAWRDWQHETGEAG